jgi:hypothetical protein
MSALDRLAGEGETQYSYRPPPLPTEAIKLAALHAAFPDFAFSVEVVRGRRCYEADLVRGDGPLRSVACISAIDLWRILNRVLLGRFVNNASTVRVAAATDAASPGRGGSPTSPGRTRRL